MVGYHPLTSALTSQGKNKVMGGVGTVLISLEEGMKRSDLWYCVLLSDSWHVTAALLIPLLLSDMDAAHQQLLTVKPSRVSAQVQTACLVPRRRQHEPQCPLWCYLACSETCPFQGRPLCQCTLLLLSALVLLCKLTVPTGISLHHLKIF